MHEARTPNGIDLGITIIAGTIVSMILQLEADSGDLLYAKHGVIALVTVFSYVLPGIVLRNARRVLRVAPNWLLMVIVGSAILSMVKTFAIFPYNSISRTDVLDMPAIIVHNFPFLAAKFLVGWVFQAFVVLIAVAFGRLIMGRIQMRNSSLD